MYWKLILDTKKKKKLELIRKSSPTADGHYGGALNELRVKHGKDKSGHDQNTWRTGQTTDGRLH